MVNYFYNICSKEEGLNFYADVLTNIRKDFYLSKEKVKGKITQNSSLNSVFYEYSLEQNKPLRWKVSNNFDILSDCKVVEDGKYHVNFYDKTGLFKKLTFSKLHTLLKVEYYNMEKSSVPYCVIEPRKSNNGLCLLINIVGSYQSVILFAMPAIDDDYVSDRVEAEFADFSAVASTNDGVVRFLDSTQIEKFNNFVQKVTEEKAEYFQPESYIDEADAVLAKTLNPKDFNVKKNLSQAIDITKAQEFSFDEDDGFEDFIDIPEEDFKKDFDVCDDYIESQEPEVIDEETDDNFEEPEVYVSSFVEYTIDDLNSDNKKADNSDDVSLIDTSADITQNADYLEDVVTQECSDDLLADDVCDTSDSALVELNACDEVTVEEDIIEEDIIKETDSTVDTDDTVACNEAVSDNDFIVCHTSDPDRVVESANAKYLYFGQLDDSGNRHGYGRTATENGHTAYEGNYSDNKRNGLGSYYYKDGQLCYYGNWKDNKREGFGIGVSSVDKSVHVGSFVDNKPCGDGVRVDNKGNIEFVSKTLSDGVSVTLKFDGDKIVVIKHNKDGEIISENSSNLKYF